jgi:hypothetical protein
MNRPTLSIKTSEAPTTWRSESSQKVRVPQSLKVSSIEELRSRMQKLADGYHARPGSPPLGSLEYRYELDEQDQVQVVHVYFINKTNKRRRFVRLHRVS